MLGYLQRSVITTKIIMTNEQESESLTYFEGRTFIIGREGHIFIRDPSASKHHAEMKISNGKFYIRDLDSTNGTYLLRNKKLVKFDAGPVHPDQRLIIGREVFTARSLLRTISTFATN
jgi:pSer/pThr/pTyr-binding forkhead associated (FHA) protein